MDATELIRLLNADHYSPANLEEVNDLCRNYPMFNLAHALKVRIGTALGNPEDDALKIAAVYAVDRSRLYQMVNEVNPAVRVEKDREAEPQEPDGIQFSEESTQQADIIIVQHAPYAASEPDDNLLELDEDEPVEASGSREEEGSAPPDEDPGSGEISEAEEEERELSAEELRSGDVSEAEEEERELSSEDLVGVVVKDEADMEEPMPEGSDVPVIDVVEPEEGEEQELDQKPETPDNREFRTETETVTDEDTRDGKEEQPDTPESKLLIEQFIRGEPGPIRADREISLKGDVSVASIREHDGFITDTLAKIYVKQGLYAKAIYAYEKLSLKYPEKSAYFAAQIDKIKNITQS